MLITGGTGFIGTALARRLCADNELVLLDRQLARSAYEISGMNGHPHVTLLQGDILDEKAVARAVAGVDSAIHLAALVGVNNVRARARDTIEINLLGTVTLLKALERVQGLKRFVFFSTSEVFGINSFRVHEETSTSIGPVQEARWSYSISKLAGEHLVQSYHREGRLPSVTIRPFNVFGPGRIGDHAMLRFVMAALKNQDIVVHGTGDQIRSWCYIDDLVDGVLSSLVREEAVGEDFNLGNPRNTLTIYELARRVVLLTNSKSKIRFEEPDFSDIDIRVPRLEKARKLLGFEPTVELDEGIVATASWCAEHAREVEEALAAAPKAICREVTLEPEAQVTRLADRRPSGPEHLSQHTAKNFAGR
jgi:nucleoside-diphosphate-sugar epimerase